MIETLTIARPDDWHLHLRDGPMLAAVLPYTTRHFARAIIMPNLVPPVVTLADALAYRARIMAAVPAGQDFEPLMTLYLTERSRVQDIEAAVDSGLVHAVKLYPAGATTNSDSGVQNIERVMAVLESMARLGLPLCVHGEVTDPQVDIFDREAVFIERVLQPLRQRLPELRVVMEHITTSDGVQYVEAAGSNLAATVTPHHLMINRNHLLVGGIRPHYYCLPIVKREQHRLALVKAVTQGDRRFFLGTDSAPHLTQDKQSDCGCAGVFNASNTLSCLAQVFEQNQALSNLEAFTSKNGPAFYGLPINTQTLRLRRREVAANFERQIDTAAGVVTVFDPTCEVFWQVED